MPLNSNLLAAIAGIVVLTGSAVGVTYVAGAGPFQHGDGPALQNFTTTGPACATENSSGTSFELAPDGDHSTLTIESGVQVPDLAHDLGNATLEQTGPQNYTFSVATTEPANGTMGAMCIGIVEYTAELSIPESPNSTFSVVVREDSERVARLLNTPNGSGVSMSTTAADH